MHAIRVCLTGASLPHLESPAWPDRTAAPTRILRLVTEWLGGKSGDNLRTSRTTHPRTSVRGRTPHQLLQVGPAQRHTLCRENAAYLRSRRLRLWPFSCEGGRVGRRMAAGRMQRSGGACLSAWVANPVFAILRDTWTPEHAVGDAGVAQGCPERREAS